MWKYYCYCIWIQRSWTWIFKSYLNFILYRSALSVVQFDKEVSNQTSQVENVNSSLQKWLTESRQELNEKLEKMRQAREEKNWWQKQSSWNHNIYIDFQFNLRNYDELIWMNSECLFKLLLFLIQFLVIPPLGVEMSMPT